MRKSGVRFKQLPFDIFVYMTQRGELSIEDILNTCDSSEEMQEFCDKNKQEIFRKILEKHHINLNNVNPLFSEWTPKDLVERLPHRIYDEINAAEVFPIGNVPSSKYVNFVIPDCVIRSFAEFLDIELDVFVENEFFRKIINNHYLCYENENIEGFVKYNKVNFGLGLGGWSPKFYQMWDVNWKLGNKFGNKFDNNYVDVIIEVEPRKYEKNAQEPQFYVVGDDVSNNNVRQILINGVYISNEDLQLLNTSLDL